MLKLAGQTFMNMSEHVPSVAWSPMKTEMNKVLHLLKGVIKYLPSWRRIDCPGKSNFSRYLQKVAQHHTFKCPGSRQLLLATDNAKSIIPQKNHGLPRSRQDTPCSSSLNTSLTAMPPLGFRRIKMHTLVPFWPWMADTFSWCNSPP